MSQEIKVPDIGDFDAVEVIEVLVAVGDEVAEEQPLITLESDKATMEVPATSAGRIAEVRVKEGDKVGEGDVIVVLEDSGGGAEEKETADSADDAGKNKDKENQSAAAPVAPRASTQQETQNRKHETSAEGAPDCDLIVLGAGPGGYTAAFRAADLGLDVVLVERYPALGGVCLNVGCIPSKALLHAAKVVDDAAVMADKGIRFGKPEIELDKLMSWKTSVVERLTSGLVGLAKKRKVRVLQGTARFADAHRVVIEHAGETQHLSFAHAIVAAGSEAVMLPDLPEDERIVTSTGALSPTDLPDSLLVIGGGIIGLEMANVYASLGSKVDVVEMTPDLIPGADRDLVKPLARRMAQRCRHLWTSTKVTGVKANPKSLTVSFDGKDAPDSERYDRVLVAVGRRPNGGRIGADAAGVAVDERGFIAVDAQCRTNVGHIFAIGDITGEPQLAHRASHMGKVAAEVAAGHKAGFDAIGIPSVVYTDPEVAWVGVTEKQAKADGIAVKKGSFPWAASGRALGMGVDEGLTKILFDGETGRVVGAGAVGPGAGELIAELGLAIEMGADAEDIALTVHAHPTLSETVGMAAEASLGTLTDLYLPKRG
ncbi:dihydrolipoyl dehydrogenase [Spectribacter acetivorans]|uniref:dihydrolipoyl dehydrogenase n=1 Tax=Spectribacter acetivorans TaxID=3075603 RepID=UPI0032C21476